MTSNGLAHDYRDALARRLRELNLPGWQGFIRDWISFNTLYTPAQGRTEREQVMNMVRQSVSADHATDLLATLVEPISFFSALPPGNMRYGRRDPRFRQRSLEDLTVVNETTLNAVERLAHLMSVVYQIRCNLLHGEKDPIEERDRELVQRSYFVLSAALGVLLPPPK
jgi:hypothetical protein